MAEGHPYGDSFGPGDVIGSYINLLKPRRSLQDEMPGNGSMSRPECRDTVPLHCESSNNTNNLEPHLGQRKNCRKKSMQEKLDPTKPGIKIVQGSEIRFFKNGIDQGVAFRNVHEGNLALNPSCLTGVDRTPSLYIVR